MPHQLTENEFLTRLRARSIPVQRVERARSGAFRVYLDDDMSHDRLAQLVELVNEMPEVFEATEEPPPPRLGIVNVIPTYVARDRRRRSPETPPVAAGPPDSLRR